VPERVRIEAPDAGSATALLYRLRRFDCRLVGREGGAFDVSVESTLTGRDVNRLIDDVLAAVDVWLAEHRIGAVTIHVHGERYSMQPPQSSEQIA
jgi:hypothetical protein